MLSSVDIAMSRLQRALECLHTERFDESAVLSPIRHCSDVGRSISAEHGLGQMKRENISQPSIAAVKVMRDMKNSFDPRGIMNPGKVLPSTSHQL